MWKNFYIQQNENAKRASRIEENSQSHHETERLASVHNVTNTAVDPSNISTTSPNQGTNKPTGMSAHDVASKFTLNREQHRAFNIITQHRISKNKDQLRMYIGDPGGTGKSRVISALEEFFATRGESRLLRLSSYTGIAACNISRMTLHSALHLNGHSKRNTGFNNNLIAAWQGVEYLFIDEVSMIGCEFLAKINESLRRAKENDKLFGGINIIFAGDFAQLPPVGDSSLYSAVKKTNGKDNKTQNAIFGKLLWMSVNTVVMLTDIVRQSGLENAGFQALLQRLQIGACTKSDYEALNEHLLSKLDIEWGNSDWDVAPIVVCDNETKDALNIEAAASFAQARNEDLNLYYPILTRHGKKLEDPELNDQLNTLHTGRTHGIMGSLPLASGMPVMLCHNYDVPSGAVNGTVGIVKSINFSTDEHGNRFATSCIVESKCAKYEGENGLLPGEFYVFPEDTSITIRHPHTGINCTVHRKQLPLVPAFAVTAHKSQGQTYPKVLLDLNDCRGSAAPYVMLSRATALNNVIILRPFPIARIQCRQSEDNRLEFRRLGLLRLQTIIQHGSPSEKSQAFALLGDLSNDIHEWCNADLRINNTDSALVRVSAICGHVAKLNDINYTEHAFSNKRQASCLAGDSEQ